MESLVKIWQFYLACFMASIILKVCESCTPFTENNLVSVNNDLVQYITEAAEAVIPVFNASTVPNLDSITEQFNAGSSNEDKDLNITQILNKYGYTTETHQVNSNGYILDIFRIPGSGTPVLVVHGLLSSPDDFVSTGPSRGLAYILADQGYDVWLGTVRGSVHGRKHITLSPECAEFWDFSWDEIGRFDLPATIDYILETTGQEKLAYVGHSQGCTSFLVMTSELPEYNDKISVMIALSAVSYLKYTTNHPFNILAPISDPFYLTAQSIGLYELAPRNQITDIFSSVACGTPFTATVLCYNIFGLLDGFDLAQVNATILPAFFGHAPGGSSTKQLVHYLQLVNSGKFRNFDYGLTGNLEKYGLINPPDYPLQNITSKMVVFYSDSDTLFSTPDREHLLKQLPNVLETYRVPVAKFQHTDYVIANDLKTLVNDKVVKFLKKYV